MTANTSKTEGDSCAHEICGSGQGCRLLHRHPAGRRTVTRPRHRPGADRQRACVGAYRDAGGVGVEVVMTFVVGQRVRCVDADPFTIITNGTEYSVVSISDDGKWLRVI